MILKNLSNPNSGLLSAFPAFKKDFAKDIATF